MSGATQWPRTLRWAVWLPIACAAIVGTAYAPSRAASPASAADKKIEGGILPGLEDYFAVDAVDADHAWIVGSYGTALLLRDRGKQVELHPPPTHEPLFSVNFRDASTGVIGGRGGRVFRTTDGGQSWSVSDTAGAKENVLALARAHNPQIVWAVGPSGMVLQSTDDGATWHDRSLGKDITLNGVTFVDDQEGWIVGEFGTILHTTDGGASWQQSGDIKGLPPYAEDVTEEVALRLGIPPLSSEDLYLFDVAFTNADTGYTVAAGGFVLTTTDRGQHWTALRAGTRNTLFTVRSTPVGNLIATGVLGTIVHGRGNVWSADEQISHRLFTWIRGIDFSSDGAIGVAVGGKAAVLISADKGDTWEAVPRERLEAARPGEAS
jgi:photosystem II stability/assembly factor-like uncharacterized protein